MLVNANNLLKDQQVNSIFLYLPPYCRKNEAGLSDSAGAPPEKKVLLEPSSALQTLTSSVADVKAVTKEPTVRKIIKLKRPGRTAPPII